MRRSGQGRSQVEQVAFGAGEAPSGFQRIDHAPGSDRYHHRHGATAVRDLDVLPVSNPPHCGRRILLQLPNSDPLHVRQRSTLPAALPRDRV